MAQDRDAQPGLDRSSVGPDLSDTRAPLSEGAVNICVSLPRPKDTAFRLLICVSCGKLGWVGESKRLDGLLLRYHPLCDECRYTAV